MLYIYCVSPVSSSMFLDLFCAFQAKGHSFAREVRWHLPSFLPVTFLHFCTYVWTNQQCVGNVDALLPSIHQGGVHPDHHFVTPPPTDSLESPIHQTCMSFRASYLNCYNLGGWVCGIVNLVSHDLLYVSIQHFFFQLPVIFFFFSPDIFYLISLIQHLTLVSLQAQ